MFIYYDLNFIMPCHKQILFNSNDIIKEGRNKSIISHFKIEKAFKEIYLSFNVMNIVTSFICPSFSYNFTIFSHTC